MALKITNGGLFTRSFLVLKEDRIKFYEGSLGLGARTFKIDEIESLLLAADNTLSFQVGDRVYSILTNPNKPKHQAAIAGLVEKLERSRANTTSLRYS